MMDENEEGGVTDPGVPPPADEQEDTESHRITETESPRAQSGSDEKPVSSAVAEAAPGGYVMENLEKGDLRRTFVDRNIWMGIGIGILIILLVGGVFAAGFGVGRHTAANRTPGDNLLVPFRDGPIPAPPEEPGRRGPGRKDREERQPEGQMEEQPENQPGEQKQRHGDGDPTVSHP